MGRVSTVLVALGLSAGLAALSPAAVLADPIDAQLEAAIASHGLKGRAAFKRDWPAPDDPVVELGRELFFSNTLSGSGKVSCASCHHPFLAGGDGMALPVGVDAVDPRVAGPGRRYDVAAGKQADPHAAPGPNVPRNSPTIVNSGLYRKTLFHDGRVQRRGPIGIRSPESVRDRGRDMLAVQARLPVAAEDEMRGYRWLRFETPDTVRETLVTRLREHWQGAFAHAFGDAAPGPASVNFERLENALSDYQRSFVLLDNPWFRYLDGDASALSDSAKRGALKFFNTPDAGGFGCASCHQGDFFTDEQFHVLAMPQLGRGIKRQADGFGNNTTRDGSDLGRWESTRRQRDRYAFRTPGLLNAAASAPFGHAGAYASLANVIRHHLDPERAVSEFDFSLAHLESFGIEAADGAPPYPDAQKYTLDALAEWRRQGGKALTATPADIADLVAFVEALTDPCIRSRQCMAAWMPPADAPSPDGQRAEFVDGRGVPLAYPAGTATR